MESDDFREKIRIEEYKSYVEENRIYFNSSVQYGQAVVRGLTLINGGAIVVTMAFLAQVVRGPTAIDLAGLFWPLFMFGLGLVLAIAVGGVGYINFQLAVAGTFSPAEARDFILSNKASTDTNALSWAKRTARLAVFLALTSAALFCTASYQTAAFLTGLSG